MALAGGGRWVKLLLMGGLIGCHRAENTNVPPPSDAPAPTRAAEADSFRGAKPGDQREVAGIKLCWCPPGKFTMGSPPGEPERRPGEDQVEVTLSRGFWIGKYEVTQGQWKRVMGKLPGELTAELPEGDDFPVGNVNFAEAEAFCEKLTEVARAESGVRSPESGVGSKPPAGLQTPDSRLRTLEFRLPTEAQWEYACRAGTTTATSFGDKLSSKQANFKGEKPYNGAEEGPSLNRAAPVGSYPANSWGLHDMHGNTFEWCRDWYHLKLPGGVDPDLRDAKNTATKSEHGAISRVRRGGCWADPGWPCRSAFRLRFEPERRYDHIGFRVVAVPKPGDDRPNSQPAQETPPFGNVVGVVRFTGTVPEPQSIMVSDGSTIKHSDLVVDPKTKGLRDVMVLIADAPVQPKVTAPKPVLMDQVDWVYKPRVVAVQHGQGVRFENSHGVNHSVMAVSTVQANEFNVFVNAPIERVFEWQKPPVMIGCSLHPWMRAWIYVVQHPWFAVTDDQGKFRIEKVPPGKYTLALVHPDTNLRERRTVEVQAGKTVELAIEWQKLK